MELIIRSEIDQAEITLRYFFTVLPRGKISADVYWFYVLLHRVYFSSPEALAPRVWQSKR